MTKPRTVRRGACVSGYEGASTCSFEIYSISLVTQSQCHPTKGGRDSCFLTVPGIFFFDHRLDLTLNNGQATMAYTSVSPSTPEDIEELLLIARYGELDELKSFIEKFGTKPLIDGRDEDGNTVLHMVCGNGHLGATNPTQRTRALFQCSFTD